MSIQPDWWHALQLAHVRECIAEADKIHSADELERARSFLAAPCEQPKQPSLFEAA